MWWQPRNDLEHALAGAMEVLGAWFRDVRGVRERRRIAWGFGTGWSNKQRALVPLVLLNEEIFPAPVRVTERPEGRILEPLPLDLLGHQPFPVAFPQLDPLLHFLPVGPPRRSSIADEIFDAVLTVHEPIVCGRTGEMGTAGVVVHETDSGAACLLTAGHVFPKGVDSPVRRGRRRLFKRLWTKSLGVVIRHVVPDGKQPGWDAAVIRVFGRLPLGTRVVRNQLRYFERQESVVGYGAFSGLIRNAYVHGCLVVLEGADTEWKNCWMAAPTGILTAGDSGAAVFTRSGRKFLGLYIGQGTVGGRTGAHYVQDSFTLQEEVLKSWNIEF